MGQNKHRRFGHHLNAVIAQVHVLQLFRSNKHMYAQIIDDTVGKTLARLLLFRRMLKQSLRTPMTVAAAHLGTVIGKKVFEAGGYRGRVFGQRRLHLPR